MKIKSILQICFLKFDTQRTWASVGNKYFSMSRHPEDMAKCQSVGKISKNFEIFSKKI